MSAYLTGLLLLSSIVYIQAVIQTDNNPQAVDKNGVENWLLLLHNHKKQITLLGLESNLNHTVVDSTQTIVAFDYHLLRNLLFWATKFQIQRCRLTETQDSHLVEAIAYAESFASLSVDWVHDRIYWTDSATGQLEVATLTGESRQVLYREGNPTSVIVDPVYGKVFWVDADPHLPKVRYAWLDGTYPRRGAWQSAPVLWQADRLSPHSPLALDLQRHQLYFTQVERSQTTVMAADYRHKKIKVMVNCWSISPAMVPLEDRVYWSNSSGVYWTPAGSTDVNIISNSLNDVKQMRLVSLEIQPSEEDKCVGSSCDQECYVVDNIAHCGCQFGHSLQPDLTTCKDEGYTVLFTGNSIYRMPLQLDSGEPHPKLQLLYRNITSQISAVAVHVRLKLLIWSDNSYEAIFSASIDKPIVPQLIATSKAKSLAVDWQQDHLYWTTKGKRIYMSTIDGKLQTLVDIDPNTPESITVDPINRQLFWSNCGWEMMIMKASLNGLNRSKLVTEDIGCATSLSLDTINSRLYWVDRSRRGSSSLYYDGQIRHNFHDSRIKSLAMFEEKQLWIADHKQSLFINKSSWSTEIPLGFQPKGVVVFSKSAQLGGPDYCQDSGCTGICVPGSEVSSWSCLCPQGMFLDDDNITCLSAEQQALTGFSSSSDALTVIDYNSGSVTLDCDTFPYARNYIITLQAVSSYRSRDLEEERLKVVSNTFPITIEGLQAATSYSVVVEPQPTYLGLWKTKVSTSPPPIQVTRLPQVYKPSETLQLPWLTTQHFYDLTISWEPLVRQFYLLMFPQDLYLAELDEVEFTIKPKILLDRIRHVLKQKNVTERFYVVHHYQNKVEFDRDSTMFLYNTPYGIEFFLAMVQVSQYDKAFGIDIVLSEKTSIPFPKK